MQTLSDTLRTYTKRGLEPFPNESQCQICGFFDLGHPEVRRILNDQDPSGVQNRMVKARCKCYQEEDRRLSKRLLIRDQANLPGHTPRTFENFKAQPGTEEMLKAATRFANMDGPRLLVFAGDVGAGKTHMLSAIGHSVLERGLTVRFESSIRFVEILRNTYQDDQDAGLDKDDPRGNLSQTLAWYNNMGVMLLDDLGAERKTDFATEQINYLIEQRINTGGWLAISTNLSKDEMENRLSGRIASRVWATSPDLEAKEEATVIITTVKDFRA